MIGQAIGRYQVLSKLGEGGMGEVYRATDTKLKRQVAVKILPTTLAADHDRLARFQREAEVLASLNHPHIAGIYGLEESRSGGSSEAPINALVMELVEGEDLSERIERGAIPIDETLSIAKQIAEALEAAHERGIIHRDLKPANIKVRADGTVKVLDFGLAKAVESSQVGAAHASPVRDSPTITSPAMTAMGMILGTAAYMSPEQARGKVVDRRADIWAFGVVLFEMLSGKRAFDDEDLSLTLSKVLQRDPDFDALPATVPARVVQVLRLCLRKDPKQRLGDIRDVRLALDGAFETSAPQMAATIAAATPNTRLTWTIAALAVAMAIAVPVFLYLRNARPASESPTVRFEIDGGSGAGVVSISPDGRRLVAMGAGGAALWVRSLDQLNLQLLRGTEGAVAPFWSPDGRFIAFFADRKLKKVDLQGASPQTLCEVPAARGGTWNRNGVILFGSPNSPIQRVSASGGPPQAVTELDKSRAEIEHRGPYFLPDGNHFLFHALSSNAENSGMFVGSLDSKDRTSVMPSVQSAVFAPPHHLLFLRGNTLMTQAFDANQLRLRDDPMPVAEAVLPTPGSFSVSDDGILVHRTTAFSATDQRQLSFVDRSGKRIEVFGTPGLYQNPTLAPNQRFVAFNRAEPNNDIWIEDLDRRTASRLTFDLGVDDFPIWSPDGTRIVFSSDREGGVFQLYEKQSGGGRQEQLLLKTGQSKMATDWSGDGRYIIYTETDAKTGADLWLLPLFGDKKPVEYLRTPFNETQARVSPDGRWVAYRSDESGVEQVYVQSFPQAGSKWQVSTDGGRQPHWRGDGKELFYLSPVLDDQFMTVDIMSTPKDAAFKAAVPKKLFVINVLTGPVPGGQSVQRNSYDVMKDGQRLLLNSNREVNDVRPTITVVLNWAAGLGK